jgi:sulfate permease, SulP family
MSTEPESSFKFASALRKTFRDGYGRGDLRADLLAGLVVGIVALPLSMALAIAVGVPPQNGLYTAIVAGAIIALCGGSRVQVSGPTAAFVVILAPITEKFGLGGLLLATVMAGVFLVVMGLSGLGRLVELVPYPVTTGFTAGIGIVIATLQLKDFFGLEAGKPPESYFGKLAWLYAAAPSWKPAELAVGCFTLLVLLTWPRFDRRLPAPLVALGLAAFFALGVEQFFPGTEIATIERRFSYVDAEGNLQAGIPRLPPAPILPWRAPGEGGRPLELSFELLRALVPSAIAIALLGAIESLLSAVVADAMIRRRHDPDAELVAQGLGNIAAPFFGGIAATGAIARTATNVRSGARSPFAALTHALFLLLAVVTLAPLLGYLPMASLAALLLVVAWNMSEARHVLLTVRTAPRSDVVVLLACLGLTVVFDMVVAVTFGIVLAALMFMKRMAEVAEVRLVAEPRRELGLDLPPSILLYQLAGPLFFGAAARAMRALEQVTPEVRAVLLDLRSVPALDATGLVNLESAVSRLRDRGIYVLLAGVDGQPRRALARAGWRNESGKLAIFRDFARAVGSAEAFVAGRGEPAENGEP